ncbi:hypothetical protein Pla175_08840 [Pirellulimonas nuda]|uniref:Uncharacterized protein n=1 Tax=Pirellulimonas nuda TaxID=2528009 RepID=A0A518D7S0_9BACT|nr:hypothetical protein [Pirellulimonas nuda]QDU87522.1 hypothetical protein Pla175_08840 [Pirellulimonas nuda]
MNFLSDQSCVQWRVDRGYPSSPPEGRPKPRSVELQSPPFHSVDFVLPQDSGRRVWLTRQLLSCIDSQTSTLYWLDDWLVWESHIPLFDRFRQSLGETRPLIETPGHLSEPCERDDGLSILVMSMLFSWDCGVFSSSGRDALFVSHDEWG